MGFEFIPLLVLMATVKKLVDFVRYARAGDFNAIVTQVVAWLGALLVVAAMAHTPWAATLVFGGVALAKLGFWGQVLVAVAIGSAASVVLVDAVKALDNQQSAAVPTLLPPGRKTVRTNR